MTINSVSHHHSDNENKNEGDKQNHDSNIKDDEDDAVLVDIAGRSKGATTEKKNCNYTYLSCHTKYTGHKNSL